MNTMNTKCYSELISLPTFEERFRYLQLGGEVGSATFGFDRYLNQAFYRSRVWRTLRDEIIVRDNGCDLGIQDRVIIDKILIHHINPITQEDLVNRNPIVLDPENLICVSNNTHEAIHYGDEGLLILDPIIRRPNDTCPWR